MSPVDQQGERIAVVHADNAAAVAAWRRRRRPRSGIDFIAALGIEHRTFRLPSGRERFQQRGVEGSKREILTSCQLDKQRVVNGDLG